MIILADLLSLVTDFANGLMPVLAGMGVSYIVDALLGHGPESGNDPTQLMTAMLNMMMLQNMMASFASMFNQGSGLGGILEVLLPIIGIVLVLFLLFKKLR